MDIRLHGNHAMLSQAILNAASCLSVRSKECPAKLAANNRMHRGSFTTFVRAASNHAENVLPQPQACSLDVEVFRFQRVLLDELATRLDLVAHQNTEHLVGRSGVLHRDLQAACGWPDRALCRAALRRPFRQGL